MKNKYLTFISIGVELIGLILISIYSGEFFVNKYNLNKMFTIILLLALLILWFVRLIFMLKKVKNND